jgi:hypothetical protein
MQHSSSRLGGGASPPLGARHIQLAVDGEPLLEDAATDTSTTYASGSGTDPSNTLFWLEDRPAGGGTQGAPPSRAYFLGGRGCSALPSKRIAANFNSANAPVRPRVPRAPRCPAARPTGTGRR